MQRLRLTYARREEMKYVSHLDLARAWERAVRRARLPIAYSSGFTPHPRMSFAAPLAVGVTTAADLMELYLAEPLPPADVCARLAAQLPAGLAVVTAVEVDLAAPSLQSQVKAAEYVVLLPAAVPDLTVRVEKLLVQIEVPYERRREGKAKVIDLRPFIQSLAVVASDGRQGLTMRLRMDNSGSVRPEEVVGALGLADQGLRIHRTGLLLAG